MVVACLNNKVFWTTKNANQMLIGAVSSNGDHIFRTSLDVVYPSRHHY